MMMRSAALLLCLALAACDARAPAGPATPTVTPRDTALATTELAAGRFEEAGRAAADSLARRRDDSVAAAVRALATYQAAMDRMWLELEALAEGVGRGFRLDDARLDVALVRAERDLAAVDADLAIAAADPGFALELCLACWERDWNRTGEIDDGDRLLFQIEQDASGKELAEDDPRRRPTFRFDVGDVHWARAMISFQRALMKVVAAYRWSDVTSLLTSGPGQVIRIPLEDAGSVRAARDLILAGLDHADRCRLAYLAETDDDREWVPSPRQKSHAVPLPVDQALYDTWAGVVGDLRRLLRGEEGIDVAELVHLIDPERPRPRLGFLDIGRMFAEPRDIVIDVPALERIEKMPGDDTTRLHASLKVFFGVYYRDAMKATPLVARLARMRAELERGDEELGRKLRYLLWLN